MKKQREKNDEKTPAVIEELDFEFVLFASAIIDYDYIMALIAQYTQNARPRKQKMSREMLVDLLCSSANLLDEREDIKQFIYELEEGKEMSEDEIKAGYQAFKQEKLDNELAAIAKKHELATDSLQVFVTEIMNRMIFDGEKLSDLMAPFHLGWKARSEKELALMNDLVPYLERLAEGREISGLSAYE